MLSPAREPPQSQQQQQQQQPQVQVGGKPLPLHAATPEMLRQMFRTSSSGISMLSYASHKSYCRSGEINAEAADEETAGTAAPAIGSADHKHVHQMLSTAETGAGAAAAAVAQLGTVPEGDGELVSTNGSSNNAVRAPAAGPAAERLLPGAGTAAGGGVTSSSNSSSVRERLTAGRMAKAPPMMSRSAYLQVRSSTVCDMML